MNVVRIGAVCVEEQMLLGCVPSAELLQISELALVFEFTENAERSPLGVFLFFAFFAGVRAIASGTRISPIRSLEKRLRTKPLRSLSSPRIVPQNSLSLWLIATEKLTAA